MIASLLDSNEKALERATALLICAQAIGNKAEARRLWLEICRFHKMRSAEKNQARTDGI